MSEVLKKVTRKPKYQSSNENLAKGREKLAQIRAQKAKEMAAQVKLQPPGPETNVKMAENGPEKPDFGPFSQNGGCPGPAPEDDFEPENDDSGDEKLYIVGDQFADREFKAAMLEMAKNIKKLKKIEKEKLKMKARAPAPAVVAQPQQGGQFLMGPNQGYVPSPIYGMGKPDPYIHGQLRNSLACLKY